MWTLFVPALDCLVRYKPGIATAASIITGRFPTVHVGFVLVFYADGQSVKLHFSVLCEVKYVFVTIVQEARVVYWFEMTNADVSSYVGIVSHIIFSY